VEFPILSGERDGKHIEIKQAANTGSFHYSYKSTFSIVLLATVNTNYEFVMVDVGVKGRASDG
jgi:hypothetical protein